MLLSAFGLQGTIIAVWTLLSIPNWVTKDQWLCSIFKLIYGLWNYPYLDWDIKWRSFSNFSDLLYFKREILAWVILSSFPEKSNLSRNPTMSLELRKIGLNSVPNAALHGSYSFLKGKNLKGCIIFIKFTFSLQKSTLIWGLVIAKLICIINGGS